MWSLDPNDVGARAVATDHAVGARGAMVFSFGASADDRRRVAELFEDRPPQVVQVPAPGERVSECV